MSHTVFNINDFIIISCIELLLHLLSGYFVASFIYQAIVEIVYKHLLILYNNTPP